MTVALCAYVGGLAGTVKRRGRGTLTVIAVSLGAGVAIGAVVVIALTVLTRLRQLVFAAITATVNGVAAIMARVPQLQAAAQELKRLLAEALNYWPWLVLGYAAVAIIVASVIGWWVLSRVLQRLRGIPDVHKLDAPVRGGPIQPVPVRLDEVRYRYQNTEHDALRAISVQIEPGEHVAVTGENGSGKTTLMLVLAGREPTSGTVVRPGCGGPGPARRHRGRPAALRRARCWAPGSPTTWCGGCRPGKPLTSADYCVKSGWRASKNATPAGCPAVNCSAWR